MDQHLDEGSATSGAGDAAQGERALVLLLDDSADHRALAARAFERAPDLRLQTVATLAQAVAEIPVRPPDLILADLRLPDGAGTELLRHVDGRERPGIPVIILTAHGDEAVAVGAMKAGALDYVVKSPHTLAALPDIARRGLREWRLLRDKELAQARLRDLNEHLEQRVSERTAALQAALQDLDAFNHTVSHDLRAPIRHILGFIGLLREQASSAHDATAARYLDTIETAARRMDQMLLDLLQLSRTDLHDLQMRRTPLREAVETAWQDLRVEWAGRPVEWSVEAPLPAVHADASLLRMVLVNLLSNALKFSRARTPARIAVSAQREATEHIVCVSDNGVGFDMRQARRLFGVFQRLHEPAAFEGNGMGLANVRRIIARHGGRVWAESAPGRGAQFYFSLPCPREEEEEEEHP